MHPPPRLRLALAFVVVLPLAACGGPSSSGSTGSTVGQPPPTTGGGATAAPVPTPRDVCEHFADLNKIHSEHRARLVDDCVVGMAEEERLRGPVEWEKIARCAMEAWSDAALAECDQKYPRVDTSTATTSGVKEDRACGHIIDLQDQAEGKAIDAAGRSQLMASCRELLAEERQNMTGARYDAFVQCLIDAPTLDALELCD